MRRRNPPASRLIVWGVQRKRRAQAGRSCSGRTSRWKVRSHAYARVRESLDEVSSAQITSQQMTAVVARVDGLLEIDLQDARHLFWEEMKRVIFAMRDTEAEDLDSELMGDFFTAMNGVANVLAG